MISAYNHTVSSMQIMPEVEVLGFRHGFRFQVQR